jgi:hypothetical protein
MTTLTGDFNAIVHGNRLVVLAPEGFSAAVGTSVLVEDGEGNSCSGVVLTHSRTLVDVSLDLETWRSEE